MLNWVNLVLVITPVKKFINMKKIADALQKLVKNGKIRYF